uniref:Splicing factor 3A subunit 1 n=1 Tax=Strongyloides papillosus TaxID=174720 RepID=A0A0N5CB43_STREA
MALVPVLKKDDVPVNLEPSMSGKEFNALIFPPPDIRSIIDKTASFVAQHGEHFETKIKEKERENKKFKFMFSNDPYHVYYRFQIDSFKKTGTPMSINKLKESKSENEAEEVKAKFVFTPKDPPRPYRFSDDPCTLNSYDLAVMRLVARYTAMHGRNFSTQLMNREVRNLAFDFLKSHHPNHPYYQKLVDQYRIVLAMPKAAKTALIEDMKFDKVHESLEYRLRYIEWESKQKNGQVSEEEAERKAYQQIDWHSFVIVKTLDFEKDDLMSLPKFCNKLNLSSRVSVLNTVLSEKDENGVDNTQYNGYLNPVPSVANENGNENNDDGAMEIEEESQVLPELGKDIIIREFDPKKHLRNVIKQNEAFIISPLTNEKVSVDKLHEHVRYNTVTPQFKEQRERELSMRNEDSAIAPDCDVSENIKAMAQKRKEILNEEIKAKKAKENTIKLADIIAKDKAAAQEQTSSYLSSIGIKPTIPIPPIIQHQPETTSYFQAIPPIQQTVPLANVNVGGFYYPPQENVNVVESYVGFMPNPPVVDNSTLIPPIKKSKMESDLLPEEEFLKISPPTIEVSIEIPNQEENGLKGQVLHISIEVKSTVGDLKGKISTSINIPTSKIKLSHEGIFLKDAQSIAAYNLKSGSFLNLSLKERGGKKK